ncbi:MAG: acetate/propionate family kinase, partial [Verrucomicrobia bacterium]|nr:acetate/propionate family kinase [Verrucomicrobiota bacterium]
MKPKDQHILSINGGSSSIKFALFNRKKQLTQVLRGKIERIGLPASTFYVEGSFSKPLTLTDYQSAIDTLISWISKQHQLVPITAIGHRIVHGGPKYYKPQIINEKMLQELSNLTSFDPEHLPNEILLIKSLQKAFPNLPQVACFDTAFHHDLPLEARLLSIPRKYETLGIRRYGFHGLSYEFLLKELIRLDETSVMKGRLILLHLGNGASLCAVRNGKSIDTSMSFTPSAGVPMGTRSGDLDPGLHSYLAHIENLTIKEFYDMVNFKSGLLGLSEVSSDLRDLLKVEKENLKAHEAISLFCYQVKKWIGAFAASLGGIDTLVFSGGIGENSAEIRARICKGLEFLGIELEENQNTIHASI